MVRVRSRHTVASGETHEYVSTPLRRSFRTPDGRVGNQTLANLSALPDAAIDAVEAVLKGKTPHRRPRGCRAGRDSAAAARTFRRGRRPGRPAGFPQLLGPPCPDRDLAYALIISRVVAPRPKSATLSWWSDVRRCGSPI